VVAPESGHRSEAPPAAAALSDELRSSIERHVATLIDAARTRAEAIEREATERAERVTAEAHGSVSELLQAERDRAWAILGGIEQLESRVVELIGSVRTELEGLVADLDERLGEPADERGADVERTEAAVPGAVPAPAPSDSPLD
jgi:F0F1-type ATP synthase membrane subunit b/b'